MQIASALRTAAAQTRDPTQRALYERALTHSTWATQSSSMLHGLQDTPIALPPEASGLGLFLSLIHI